MDLSLWCEPRSPFGVALNYLDLEFRVDAMHSGIHDRTLQPTYGATVYLTGGATFASGEKWRFTWEVFYSWLSVGRPPSTTLENDGFLNFRFLAYYRITEARGARRFRTKRGAGANHGRTDTAAISSRPRESLSIALSSLSVSRRTSSSVPRAKAPARPGNGWPA